MKGYRVNHEIRSNFVRLIEGANQNIVPLSEAILKAQSLDLDLVEVSPNADPPVCKIMDYKKIRFDEEKKGRELKKKQKTSNVVKEIRMQPAISAHDLDFKVKNMRQFLEEGKRVRVTVRFRGRQLAHMNIGQKLLENIKEKLNDIAVIEGQIGVEGRAMGMLLVKKS